MLIEAPQHSLIQKYSWQFCQVQSCCIPDRIHLKIALYGNSRLNLLCKIAAKLLLIHESDVDGIYVSNLHSVIQKGQTPEF